MARERRDVARGQMLLDEPGEVDVQQDVRVVDDERPARQEGLRVLERAARPEDRILGKEDDALVPRRRGGPGAQEIRLPVQVDADRAVAHGRELAQDALDDRRPENRQERLGQVVRGRP